MSNERQGQHELEGTNHSAIVNPQTALASKQIDFEAPTQFTYLTTVPDNWSKTLSALFEKANSSDFAESLPIPLHLSDESGFPMMIAITTRAIKHNPSMTAIARKGRMLSKKRSEVMRQ